MPTVLVTSSSRGLGREFVRQYAREGWQVIAACRHPEVVADDLRHFGGSVRPIAMDVTDIASVEAVAREGSTPVDLLLNTAGIIGQLDDAPGAVSYSDWSRTLDVNVLGAVRVLDAMADRLSAAHGKAITLTSGMGSIGMLTSPGSMMYRTSKAAVNMAMAARALALRPRGITVAVLNPGWVRTDMGGSGGQLSPEDSVEAMRRVIAGLTPQDAGRFLNWHGDDMPW